MYLLMSFGPAFLLSSRNVIAPLLHLHSLTGRHLLRRRPSVVRASFFFAGRPPQMESEGFKFGPYVISGKEVFFTTELSFAFVNLRPVVPVKRFPDLTPEEISDLWLSAQKIGRHLESYHEASSLTFTIQDGPQAGQSVPHVHIHILPRKSGDFENNDEIYDAIDMKEKELKQKLDLDKERKDRSIEEMALEAGEYRKLLAETP